MRFQQLLILAALSSILISCDLFPRLSQEDEITTKRNLVTAINRISSNSELVTAEATISKIFTAEDLQWYGDVKLVYSCIAYVKAGIDFRSFAPQNITYDKDMNSVELHLPHAKMLDFDMPTEKIKLESEFSSKSFFRSDLTPEQKNEIMRKAEDDIKANVEYYGVLPLAEANALSIFKTIFGQIGIENVYLQFE